MDLNRLSDLSGLSELDVARHHIETADLVGEQQEKYRAQLLQWISDHDDALYRTCLKGHLTGSAFIIDPSRPATLLIHHKKLKLWLQPGGHADGQGDLSKVALREAEEETGLTSLQVVSPAIDLDVHSIPERGDEPTHLHLDVRFLVIAAAGAIADPDEIETLGAKWVTQDDPGGVIATPDLRRLADRAFDVAGKL